MTTELKKVDPKEYGLEVEQVSTIEQAFLPKIQEREALVAIYDQLITSELTPDLCKQAKEVRLRLVKVRTGISDIHKAQKAFFLAAGRFVDAWKNKETLPVEQMEEKLSEIENYYINIEKARKAQLQSERQIEVSKYTDYPASALGDMEQQVYDAYLQGLKVAYQAKIEAERKEEEERIAAIEAEKLNKERKEKALPFFDFWSDFEKTLNFGEQSESDFNNFIDRVSNLKTAHDNEQARIKSENERLQKESEQKEKELAAERAKAEAERKALEEKAKKEREEANAILKAEQERSRIEAEKAASEKAKLEAELKVKLDKEAAELKAKQDAEKQAQIEAEKAAKAPFKEKANKWVDSFSIPEFTEQNTTTDDIKIKFASFVKWAKSEINKL